MLSRLLRLRLLPALALLAIMDPLFDLDAKGELVPVLAESFGYSDSVIDLAVQQVPTSGHVPVNEWRPSWLSAECRGPS
jgi:hypothetical protein